MMKKRLIAILLSASLAIGMCATACAAASGFSDVPNGVWYADAVAYQINHGLMSGTDTTLFSPNEPMSRAMLAAVLYRAEGSPAISDTAIFPDVSDDAWFADAAAWASSSGLISGYSDGRFAGDDPISREQLATILWRAHNSPTPAGSGTGFADQWAMSPYAVSAIAWARETSLMNGKGEGRFDPLGQATRAEVAVILMRAANDGFPPAPAEDNKVLIAYFSATGATKNVAEKLDRILDAVRYEIVPANPYTASELNYNDSGSRSQIEQRNSSARPAIANSAANMDAYDVVFLGYPIWNGQAPRIISTFLESYDFAGKTIIPFCTSGSSGIGSSAEYLQKLAPESTWQTGSRFESSVSQDSLAAWVKSLNLSNLSAAPETTDKPQSPSEAVRLSLAFGENEAFAELQANATTRDFLSMLPTTLTFEDFSGSEKISYLPRSLSTDGRPESYDPVLGDLTLFVPWGNLAVFYQDTSGASSSLVPMGHIVSGLELLTAQTGSFDVYVSVIY